MSVLGRLCANVSRFSFQMKSCEIWPSRQFRTKRRGVGRDNVGAQPVVEDVRLPLVGFSALKRPFLFGIAFSGGTFCTCAIWQYENMREAARRARHPFLNMGKDIFGRKAGDFS